MGARNRLSAGFMKKPEPGKHLDGAGLWLVVREDGGGTAVLATCGIPLCAPIHTSPADGPPSASGLLLHRRAQHAARLPVRQCNACVQTQSKTDGKITKKHGGAYGPAVRLYQHSSSVITFTYKPGFRWHLPWASGYRSKRSSCPRSACLGQPQRRPQLRLYWRL